MRVLVTGADGFVGRHLCRYLTQRGDEVLALTGAVQVAGLDASWQRSVDFVDPEASARALAEARPEAVIHLAGFSSVGKSHQNPHQAFAVNTLGTVNLLRAVRDHTRNARVIAVSSGEVYGSLEPGSRADEAHSTVPLSPYSASKLAAEIACQQAQLAGLDVMIVRPFNHLGRGQTGSFVVPAFAQQLAALAGRAAATLRVGDLSPVRDFLHVADVVEAYRLLLERGLGGQIYNIASGVGRSIRDLLSELIELSGADVTPEQDPERMRPNEIPYLVGDANKLQKLGWSPSRTIRQALSEVLQEAREAAQV